MSEDALMLAIKARISEMNPDGFPPSEFGDYELGMYATWRFSDKDVLLVPVSVLGMNLDLSDLDLEAVVAAYAGGVISAAVDEAARRGYHATEDGEAK